MKLAENLKRLSAERRTSLRELAFGEADPHSSRTSEFALQERSPATCGSLCTGSRGEGWGRERESSPHDPITSTSGISKWLTRKSKDGGNTWVNSDLTYCASATSTWGVDIVATSDGNVLVAGVCTTSSQGYSFIRKIYGN